MALSFIDDENWRDFKTQTNSYMHYRLAIIRQIMRRLLFSPIFITHAQNFTNSNAHASPDRLRWHQSRQSDRVKKCEWCDTERRQKLEGARESAYLSHANFYRRPFFENFLRSHVRTVPGNMHVKFEVRSFNRFKLVWLNGPLRTDRQTHTRTHIERTHYLRHSLRSIGGDNETGVLTDLRATMMRSCCASSSAETCEKSSSCCCWNTAVDGSDISSSQNVSHWTSFATQQRIQ